MNTADAPDEYRRLVERLALLQSLTASLAAARTPEAIATVIMGEALQRLRAEIAVLAIVGEDGATLKNVGFEGVSAETQAQWQTYSIDAPVPVAVCAKTGELQCVRSREERNRAYPELAAVHGADQGGPVIALPLKVARRTAGVLAFCFPDAPAFEEHDIDFFRALADQCAVALERASLEAELRRRESELRSREERLELIHRTAGIGAWEWNSQTNEVFWSSQYREVYGLNEHETPSFDRGIAVVVEEDRQRTLAELGEAFAAGRDFRSEHRIRHPRKGGRWVAAAGAVVPGDDGAPARMVGIVIDITEIKRAEIALRESEARFRGLMEQAPVSVQVFAPNGDTVQVNEAWSKLWGFTLAEIGGYNILEDVQLQARGVMPYVRRAFAGEAVEIPEILYEPPSPDRSPRKDDAARWVSAVAYPRKDDAGALREVVLIHRDVTAERRAAAALRDSEEKFRLLAETIPQLAWMARPDGEIFWYNRRWYEYTGTTPEKMRGTGWHSVHDPRVLPRVIKRWNRSLAAGEPFEMVFPLKAADGEFRPFLTRMNPLRDGQGGILYWFGTNTDISEMKRMEDALRDADRRKDEFLATLAHELRNPLAPIHNALQILKMPRAGAATAQHAKDVMERQVQQLSRLVDDLLDVSRVMRGKVELRRERVDLADVIARALETAQPLIETQAHRLNVYLPERSLPVSADPLRLAQVFGNLLTNAAKFTAAEGTIDVTARVQKDCALVTVSDNGAGIDHSLLPHVFDLFVQGEHTVAKSHGGLGIGLTLVKSLVEMHGGSVAAQSPGPGRGSSFTVRLPLLEASEAMVLDNGEPLAAPVFASTRLLVVDDNRDAADTLAALLRMRGHDVRAAYDGPSALEAARAHQPALVFLDIGMPGMDGYEVASRMREMPELKNAVLAALSGWAQASDRVRSRAAGFDHHLVKPATESAIEALIAALQSNSGR